MVKGENELMHYGILGMKWGVRRSEAQLARARGKKTSDDDDSSDAKNSSSKAQSTSSKKKISEMSDDELRKTVTRLQLEKQYRDLSPKTVSLGEKAVKTAMKQVVIPSVTTASRNALTSYIEKEIKKRVK